MASLPYMGARNRTAHDALQTHRAHDPGGVRFGVVPERPEKTFRYDEAGRLVGSQVADFETLLGYDNRGRLIRRDHTNGLDTLSSSVELSVDGFVQRSEVRADGGPAPASSVHAYTRGPRGTVAEVTLPTLEVVWYDRDGFGWARGITLGDLTVNQTFDDHGNVLTRQIGGETTYSYDGHDRLASSGNARSQTHMTYRGGSSRLAQVARQDALGGVSTLAFPSYDGFGRPLSMSTDDDRFDLSHPQLGNTSSKILSQSGKQFPFDYDDAGRLVGASDGLLSMAWSTRAPSFPGTPSKRRLHRASRPARLRRAHSRRPEQGFRSLPAPMGWGRRSPRLRRRADGNSARTHGSTPRAVCPGLRRVLAVLGHEHFRTTVIYPDVSTAKLREVHRQTQPFEK